MPEPIITVMSDELVRIYQSSFSGKEKGRFRIKRSLLRKLSQSLRFERLLPELTNSLLDKGFLLIDLGDYFGLLELQVMQNWRIAPKKVVFSSNPIFVGESMDEDED